MCRYLWQRACQFERGFPAEIGATVAAVRVRRGQLIPDGADLAGQEAWDCKEVQSKIVPQLDTNESLE